MFSLVDRHWHYERREKRRRSSTSVYICINFIQGVNAKHQDDTAWSCLEVFVHISSHCVRSRRLFFDDGYNRNEKSPCSIDQSIWTAPPPNVSKRCLLLFAHLRSGPTMYKDQAASAEFVVVHLAWCVQNFVLTWYSWSRTLLQFRVFSTVRLRYAAWRSSVLNFLTGIWVLEE